MDIVRRRHSPIGIDIGPTAVKLVQFRARALGLELLAAARLELPFPNNGEGKPDRAAFSRELHKELKAAAFGVRRAVVTLPAADVDVRPLTLPTDHNDVARMVRWEAESYLDYPTDEAILDHVVLGEAKAAGERRLEVLAAAARKTRVLAALDLLARAGLLVDAVDIVPLALTRALQYAQPEADRATVAVDIGAATTHTVIADGGELRMSRTLDFGGDALTDAIAEALEVGRDEAEHLKRQHGVGLVDEVPAEADLEEPTAESEEARKIARIINDILRDKLDQLARELSKLLRYFSAQNQGRRVEQVFLVGGGGSLRDLDRVLAARLDAEVKHGAPIRRITRRAGAADGVDDGALAVAAGLALRGI
ncbi:MAG: type IV pilus assembly protein PilM [Planctomycetota bacterium]